MLRQGRQESRWRILRISLCYIVRDEAEKLRRSLASCAGATDEIVVVDTGSKDDSAAVAASFGAQVYSFAWRDDFSAARNFAISKLHGDWALFLDADEWFDEQTRGNLRQVFSMANRRKDIQFLFFMREDLDEEGKAILRLPMPRAFRLHAGIAYHGRIHENLWKDGAPCGHGAAIDEKDLLLLHDGYAGASGPEKAARNLPLLLRDLQDAETEPERTRLYRYLAEACDGMGDKKGAEKYARLDIETGRKPVLYASRSCRILLGIVQERGDREERIRVARRAVRDYPELPEFRAELAEALADDLAYADAVQEMQMALEQAGKGVGSLTEPSEFGVEAQNLARHRMAHWREIAAREAKLTLSACLIVRDAGRDMERWLGNVQQAADQVIIVDTGSKDGTIAAAKAAGAEVYSFPWQGDFAAARNEALRHAHGDWVLVTDVDETMKPAEKIKPLLAKISCECPGAQAVDVLLINIDEDTGSEIQRARNQRLFRRDPAMRYEGKVHEVLYYGGHLPRVYDASQRLTVYHTGYSARRMLGKAKRNLALLGRELADGADPDRLYRYLAEAELTLGHLEKAEEYGLRAILSPWQAEDKRADLYHIVLQAMALRDEPREEQLAMARRAAEAVPGVPDFPAQVGLLLEKEGRDEEARTEMERALELAKRAGADASAFAAMRGPVYAALARIEARAGHGDAAKHWVTLGLQTAAEEQELWNAAWRIGQRDRLDEAAFSSELAAYLHDNAPDPVTLAHWAAWQGHYGLYKQLAKELGRQGIHLPETACVMRALRGERPDRAADVRLAFRLLRRLEAQEGLPPIELRREIWHELLPDEQLAYAEGQPVGVSGEIQDFLAELAEIPDADFIAATRDMLPSDEARAAFADSIADGGRDAVELYYLQHSDAQEIEARAYMLAGKLPAAAATLALRLHIEKAQRENTEDGEERDG